MNENRKYTAYCGLYCKDCIPSNNELFSLIDRLSDLLNNLGFEHYAKFKSTQVKEFQNYEVFTRILTEMRKLKCETNCYEGPISEYGCNNNCAMRKCAIEKNIEGCWECEEYKVCKKLDMHMSFHPGMENNLDMIKEFGIDHWIDKKGKHYKWSS